MNPKFHRIPTIIPSTIPVTISNQTPKNRGFSGFQDFHSFLPSLNSKSRSPTSPPLLVPQLCDWNPGKNVSQLWLPSSKQTVRPWKSKGKIEYPWESTRDVYQHIPPTYGLYSCCIGQYGVIFGEQLLGYPPKGTQNFPLRKYSPGSLEIPIGNHHFSGRAVSFREGISSKFSRWELKKICLKPPPTSTFQKVPKKP